jgi:hypothetical protein
MPRRCNEIVLTIFCRTRCSVGHDYETVACLGTKSERPVMFSPDSAEFDGVKGCYAIEG